MKAAFISFALGLALIVSSVQTAAETIVDDAALTALDQGGNWLGFGRNYSEQRFSPLDSNHGRQRGGSGRRLVCRISQRSIADGHAADRRRRDVYRRYL